MILSNPAGPQVSAGQNIGEGRPGGERAEILQLFPVARSEDIKLRLQTANRASGESALDAENVAVLLGAADSLLAAGLIDSAEAQFKIVLSLAPDDRRALAGLAVLAQSRNVRPVPKAPAPREYSDPMEQVIAAEFDIDFYLTVNSDVLSNGVDPVRHYTHWGWKEARNPNAWFDTVYYLESYADVAARGINPFWHYLVAGRAEGRKTSRPGGFEWAIIEAARDPGSITADYPRKPPDSLLTAATLADLLEGACRETNGIVLSVGHDRYTDVTGGVQIFIADEQANFARLGLTYINISPYFADLRLVDANSGQNPLNVIFDGRFAGVAETQTLIQVLAERDRPDGIRRMMVVHCLLGHQILELVRLQAALGAEQNYFWVHDYSSLCSGYALLRNDAAFCNAPPPGSTACRICVYGASRASHLASVRLLFDAIPFHVVAPSAAALDVWQSGPPLPYLSATVQEHCKLVQRAAVTQAGERGAAGDPVRVAFIGNPRPLKGWPIWLELVSRTRRMSAYRFLHLSNEAVPVPVPGVEHHHAATGAAARDGMIDALVRLQVDLVVIPSIWPETFSYVTYEALAAGAGIVCLAAGGNIAAAAAHRGRGFVAPDPAALIEFFVSLSAVEHVRARRAAGIVRSDLVQCGTTSVLHDAGLGPAVCA